MKQKQITQPNALVNASYSLNLSQKIIVLNALDKLDTRSETPYLDWIEIDLDQLYKNMGITTTKPIFYKRMQRAMFDIQSKTVLMPNTKKHRINWLHATDENNNGSKIRLKIAPDMANIMLNLKGEFTQIQYQSSMLLRSTYAIRIYELMKQWSNTKSTIKMEVLDLRTKLETVKKYPTNNLFRFKVLEPAIEQINMLTDIDIALDQKKNGRNITHYIFKISNNQQQFISKKKQNLHDLVDQMKTTNHQPRKLNSLDIAKQAVGL